MIPNKMPLNTYTNVIFRPKALKNIATATSLTRGDVIRNEKVTPRGMPPYKSYKQWNGGARAEGVMAPNKEASTYCNPYILWVLR